jgi:CRISPR/Cas system-associated endonuclease Cas1
MFRVAEDYSSNRKSKRQYLNDKIQREFVKKLDDYFESTVEIPRIMRGKRQELKTLINEEALLFAKYLRNEIPIWNPRLVALG